MNCHELAKQIAKLRPELEPVDVARLCLMILASDPEGRQMHDHVDLASAWRHVSFRHEVATDQHAAVARELSVLLGDGPIAFSPDQLWALLRAIKVQSQMLELYGVPAALE